MEAILSQSDGHGETKCVHSAHGCHRRLLKLLGGYTLQTRNTDSWEGWYWGAKHVWGCENLGQMVPVTNVMWDVSKNTDGILFWGCDPETTPWGFNGQTGQPPLLLVHRDRASNPIYIAPDLNYGAAVHADKWIPVLPNTDAALYLAIAYVWLTEGTYDKEYLETHSRGVREVPRLRSGRGGRRSQDAAMGGPDHRRALLHDQGAGPLLGEEDRLDRHRQRRPRASEAPTPPSRRRLQVLLLAMQGVGKPGVHQFKMIEWGTLQQEGQTTPSPGPSTYPALLGANRGWLYTDTPPQFIPKDLIHDAILNPPISWYGTTLSRDSVDQQFIKYTYPREGGTEIHMIWTDSPSWMTCWNDTNSYRQGPAESQDRVHPGAASLDGERLPARRPGAAVADHHGGRRHRLDSLSASFNCVFHRATAPSNPGASPRATTRSSAPSPSGSACLEEYTEGKSVEDWIKPATRPPARPGHHLRGAEGEGLLRRPARRQLATGQGRPRRTSTRIPRTTL